MAQRKESCVSLPNGGKGHFLPLPHCPLTPQLASYLLCVRTWQVGCLGQSALRPLSFYNERLVEGTELYFLWAPIKYLEHCRAFFMLFNVNNISAKQPFSFYPPFYRWENSFRDGKPSSLKTEPTGVVELAFRSKSSAVPGVREQAHLPAGSTAVLDCHTPGVVCQLDPPWGRYQMHPPPFLAMICIAGCMKTWKPAYQIRRRWVARVIGIIHDWIRT